MGEFQEKVYIVTGATGNLGQVMARTLRDAGARLVLADKADDERFASELPDLMADRERFMPYAVDLTQETAVQEMVERALNHFGQIDGLVNIAGGYRAGTPVHETEQATLDFMFNLNVRTTFLTCKAVLPHMIARERGRIVNIGARVALQGSKNAAAYSIAKTGVVRLTESMSAEVKGHGINVNAILPGTIDTPQNREAMPDADFDRWVEPQALADVILFLLSDAARAVHGASVPVYGRT